MNSTKYIKIVPICYKPVTNRTRARKNGKLIKCPKCQSVKTIYHFSWS